MKLINTQILNNRNVSIDVYRGFAILFVILFHFDKILPFGMIGVDLFFVISGYLVSKGLLKEIENNEKTNWKLFFIKRITKIIPSYYFFIIAGTIIARWLLLETHPDQVIPINELPRYILFYLNYNLNYTWSFELAWSLCVEEHFYIFLIILFLIISSISVMKNKMKTLKMSIYTFIVISILFKIAGHFYGWDTYAATHMRMDALFLGVLLSFQETNEKIINSNSIKYTLIGFGLVTVSILFFYLTSEKSFFRNSIFHTLIPISFYCLIRGTLFFKFKNSNFIRILAYYSYNWYLWHALIGYIILNKFSLTIYLALPLYLVLSFIVAVITTKLIEEPILLKRKKIIKLLNLKK